MADSRTAAPVGGPFELVDHHGHAVTQQSFAGRKALMLFGFTHCRVVCPRSLRKLSGALDRLGTAAQRIAPLYVTVDPERDDPAALRAFLQADYPRFTGLTGTRPQIDGVKQSFRVYARRRVDVDDGGDYVIAHTTLAYLLDEDGAYETHFPLDLEETDIVERLRGALG